MNNSAAATRTKTQLGIIFTVSPDNDQKTTAAARKQLHRKRCLQSIK